MFGVEQNISFEVTLKLYFCEYLVTFTETFKSESKQCK